MLLWLNSNIFFFAVVTFWNFISELVSGKDTDLTKLEMEYELQKQILKAKQKLANDETLSKNVRKKHNQDYQEAKSKVKDKL